jgi:hypothetical protein
MRRLSPVLEALARLYANRKAGRTGQSFRDVLIDVEELLKEAGAAEGDARAIAEQQIREAESEKILQIIPLHARDPHSIQQIRLSPEAEAKLFERVGKRSPTQLRVELAAQFERASHHSVPQPRGPLWKAWCERMARGALEGRSIEPFDREPTAANGDLLEVLAKLLSWEGESLVRFASCILCSDSKVLEQLAPSEKSGEFQGKLRGKLGRLLEQITQGQIRTLDDLGILPNPRFALVHGPIELKLEDGWLDLGKLQGPFRVAQRDIDRAEVIRSQAKRCMTVENETTFHELAKCQSGELLVQTSYPGSGTLALLRKLPPAMEFWHFGDSDDAGFDILRVLREMSGHDIQPLHMERGRVHFEQEALGKPTKNHWPFYG